MNTTMKTTNKEKGGTTLIVSLILLFIITLATFISNRDSILEFRSAANDYRHKQALSAAQAGAEYALVKISDKNFAEATLVDTRNTSGSGSPDGFVDRNINYSPTGVLNSDLSFAYGYSNLVSNDLVTRLKIISMGCADSCSTCSASCPVNAKITQVIAKATGPMPIPKGAVSAKGDVFIQKDENVGYNASTTPDPGNQNIIAGGTVSGAASGTYTQATPYPADSNAYAQEMLGSSIDALRRVATTVTCTTCHASDFAGLSGVVYISDPDAKINANAVIGSPEHPLVIIAAGEVTLNGTASIYGFIFGNVNIDVTGTFNMYGAAATPGNYTQKGAGQVQYDKDVLSRLSIPTTYAKVIGGWKDY